MSADLRALAIVVACASCGGSGDPTLTVVLAGTAPEGSVTSPTGLDCGTACTIDVPAGVIVPLAATAPAGVQFMGWDGGGCTGTAAACDVTIAGDTTVTATFDQKRELVDIPPSVNRDVDLLIVQDNSGGTVEEQNNFAAAFPALLDVLDDVEGGLPDLHIGVVTSDMGALGVDTGDPTCSDPDNGDLVKGDPDLADQCAQVTGNFISSIGATLNYTGTLADAFTCVSRVGSHGCGFEQHLESMRAALNNNPVNSTFVRASALLAIVIVADEDDCSASNPALFGPEDPIVGPLDSFRCFEKGVECAEGRGAALREVGPKTDCVALDDGVDGYLYPLELRYVDFLTLALGKDPRDIVVGVIAGDAAPVEVGRRTPTGTSEGRPDLFPSCTYTDINGMTNSADPGIRLRAFADAFGPSRGVAVSVCNTDYTAPMQQIGATIRRAIGYPCLAGTAYAPDACTLSSVTGSGSTPLAACTPALDNPPCWHLVTDAAICAATPTHDRIVVEGAPAGASIMGSCRIR